MSKKTLVITILLSAVYTLLTVVYFAQRMGTFKYFMATYDDFKLHFNNPVVDCIGNCSKKDFLWLGRAFENLKEIFGHNNSGKIRHIYLYTTESWFSVSTANEHFSQCPYSNCQLTKKEKFSVNADAIIFHIPYGRFKLKYPPVSGKYRKGNQPWIAMHLESPSNMDVSLMLTDHWKHSFNWTMSYRFDADIQIPYGALTLRKQPPQRNYSAIMLRKKKMALWFVSNCNAKSKRDVLVQVLQSNGVQVDIYGRCGKGRIKQTNIIDDYMFYFAFENSLCEDYITEKFFARYDSNVILVTYGGADYNTLIPNGTYINAANFENASHLANFLLSLIKDNDRYVQILKAKDKYTSADNLDLCWRYAMCELCNKVNNIEKNSRTYNNVPAVLNGSQCKTIKRINTGYMIT